MIIMKKSPAMITTQKNPAMIIMQRFPVMTTTQKNPVMLLLLLKLQKLPKLLQVQLTKVLLIKTADLDWVRLLVSFQVAL